MQEIAQQFRKELQELLDRYKTKLTVPRIMSIAQDVFHKTLSIKYHPELHTAGINFLQHTDYTKFERFINVNGLKVPAELFKEPDPEFKKMLQGEFKCID